MNTKSANAIKYRPVLTATDILKILSLAKTEVPLSPESISIVQKLSVFQTKIENNAVSPAYTMSDREPRLSTLELLGGTSNTSNTSNTNSTSNSNPDKTAVRSADYGFSSKEEYWKASYKKYQSNPTACTVEELQASQEYRYLNDLMTPEEELAHEDVIASNSKL